MMVIVLGIIEMWPGICRHKPGTMESSYTVLSSAILRAYKAADTSGDGFIQEKEFMQLLKTLQLYDKLYTDFELADTDKDRRLTLEEFQSNYKKWAPYLAIDTSQTVGAEELEQIFAEIDTNGGGMVLFEEFCMFAAKKSVSIAAAIPKPQTKSPKIKKKVKSEAVVNAPVNAPSGPSINVANWSREQIHEMFQNFDSTNNNGMYSHHFKVVFANTW